jgi:PPOX class probable F420-dependent enzyme
MIGGLFPVPVIIASMLDIPAEYRYLLADETKAYAYLATTLRDGSPQVTPVWFTTDGTHILINTKLGRSKAANMRARPRVALAIPDPAHPRRYIQVRGEVVEIFEDESLIQRLSQIYDGVPFHVRPGDVRVTYKILPRKITYYAY